MRSIIMLLLCALLFGNAGRALAQSPSQTVNAIQYYFNTDPGVGNTGNGGIIPVTPTSDFNQILGIILPNTLSYGFNNLYIRVQDQNGLWSLAERRGFILQQIAAIENIVAYQYYFDSDPGVGVAGNGAIVPVTSTADFNQTIAITIPNSLTGGFHNLYIRTKDESGQWSLAERRGFILQQIAATENIVAYQYYFDSDPGVGVAGNGAIVPVTSTADFNQTIAITIPNSLTGGFHNLYIRTKDESGQWSLAERRGMIVQPIAGNQDLVALEYYFDIDPGVGNGTPYPISSTADFNALIDVNVPCLTTGNHYLYIRAKNTSGTWSIISRDTLSVTSGVAASAVTPAGPLTICTGDSAQLSVTPVQGATYQWMQNSIDITGATANTYYVTSAGNYAVKIYCGASFTTSNAVVINTQSLVTYYADADNDGFGDATNDSVACTPPAGFVINNTDCDDNNSGVNALAQFFIDADGDGFGSTNTAMLCAVTPPPGYATNNTDCNDTDPSVHQLMLFYTDNDGDGFGSTTTAMLCAITPPVGYAANNTDCNDNDNSQWQSATLYVDADGDGYDSGTTVLCYGASIPSGYSANTLGTDCDDNDNGKWQSVLVYIDSDADGFDAGTAIICFGAAVPTGYSATTLGVDCNDFDITVQIPLQYYVDNDQDGFGSTSTAMVCAASPPAGYSNSNTDCNDNDATVNTPQLYYVDADNDGYGSVTIAMLCSSTAPAGYSGNNTDCNDSDAGVHSPLPYYVDGDGDGYGSTTIHMLCSSTVPAGYSNNNTDCNDGDAGVYTPQSYFVDFDNDGFGSTTVATLCSSSAPTGYSTNNTDCNDNDAGVHVPFTFYVDSDGDGYGSITTAVLCFSIPPAGYATNNTDCDDSNLNVWQSSLVYVDADNDGYSNVQMTVCYGATIPSGYSFSSNGTDCNDNDASVYVPLQYYVDNDLDGYGSTTTALVCASIPPAGYANNNTDCNDNNAFIHPGANEICNGLDDDCDALTDDNDPSVSGQPVWFSDADGDGFGNSSITLTQCTQPAGYVADNTDCNDNDSLEKPGQVWYTDMDGDDYGTGNTLVQCSRPANGFHPSELIATNGDCNDSNPQVYPGAQYLTFSGNSNFTGSLVYPQSGTAYTNFAFEVEYFDASNALPPATFPRVILDYEGNGIYNNTNDRMIIMYPEDVNDLNTVDGKRYIGTINSLPTGTTWQTIIQVTNGACLTQTGPFNYPDVLVLPDLQIFANDITFSSNNPPVSSSLSVSAVVHNVSDFPVQNFYVHLVNQYDNSSPSDVLVSFLAPHSSTTVSWNITTPAVPAWCPIQVTVDHTDVVQESNELDNSALRPFINGNFNLPGGIVVVNAAASPSVAYVSNGAYTTVSGRAFYYGTPVPLADSSAAGAAVTFTVVETNATFTTYTNSQGYFSYSFPSPMVAGTYNVTGTCTDFTFTAGFITQFTMITPQCLPDLRAVVNVSSSLIVAGNSVSGSIVVTNQGCATSGVNSLLDISQTGGAPGLNDVVIPPLTPNTSYTTTFTNLLFTTPGTYSLCGMADAGFEVTEANESNNSHCRVITVIPALPDIYPAGGPYGSNYICNTPNSVGFTVGNGGGVATGAFTCKIITKLNGTTVDSVEQNIANIPAFGSVSISMPVTYSSVGNYTFEVSCDIPLPNGVVAETNEQNNYAVYSKSILNCLPDLVVASCEDFDVLPVDPQHPGSVTYVATVSNIGNQTANGPIPVRFHLSGGADHDTQYNGNLAPGQNAAVSVTVPSVAPATQSLTAIADPLNTIAEWDDGNNSVTNALCWDFQPVPKPGLCGSNFWMSGYLVNQSVFLSVGLSQYNLYDASLVKVRFQVSGPGLSGTVTLGDATVNNVEQTCGCPRSANLPVSFVFPQTGTYTFTMTADPDGNYTECDETNNVLIVTVNVTALPDMRILSQHINPSLLNPQPGQPISVDVTYENIGYSNINDQMELRVLIDNIPLDSVYPVGGLVNGDNATISIPATWSSMVPGSHIIRAIIDNDNQVAEVNEVNNEATRAIVVGETANLYFQLFAASNPYPALNTGININARIGNNGDVACDADVQFYFITNALDTQYIGMVHVSVDDNDSTNITLPWVVLDNSTTLIAKIINSSVLEYTYDDNEENTVIGALALSFVSQNSCNGDNNGTLTANVMGGDPPYSYNWSNTFNGQTLTGAAGNYTVTVYDAYGQNVTGSGDIVNDPGVVYYLDLDNDGFGNPADSTISCSGTPSGYVINNTDCNDANANVHPAATEICNGMDDDCDGLTDDADPSVVGQSTWYADADGDTYGDATTSTLACTQPTGYVANDDDCNDANANVHPAATEICNGMDDDCDGLTDDADPSVVGQSTWFADADGDTYGDATTSTLACTQPLGYVANDDDCNDANANVHPAATEICNGMDDDCDGLTDDADPSVVGQSTWYADADGDTYGDATTSTLACTQPLGYVANDDDCNDANANVHPAATEICSNGIDDNCNGLVDENCTTYTWYADTDNDGYGDAGNSTTTSSPTPPSGYVSDNTDCNDQNAAIHPGATEICNGVDDNCNGLVDDGLPNYLYYTDADGDGYGNPMGGLMICNTTPPAGYVLNHSDCNDANASINPAATEICGNGIDDNCNGLTDENCGCVGNTAPVVTSVTASPDMIAQGTSTTLTAIFTDNTNVGPYEVRFNWNDGTALTIISVPQNATGTYSVSASHTYNTSAVFEPNVRVYDSCGAVSAQVSSVSTVQYLVVYVTGNQFTTMGGWFNTPAGSYMADPSFTGKVNMGNVVKPLSGAFKGELELNINAKNFKVHAVNPTTWDYLTVSGCCFAQFRGSCKINNVTGYKVLVAQTDHNYSCGQFGGNDMIRVKVWNQTTGQVIYDTQPGDPDNAIPVTELDGGSIKVHTQNSCVARPMEITFQVDLYPNPADAVLNFNITSDQEQELEVRMIDMTGRMVYLLPLNGIRGGNIGVIQTGDMKRGIYFIEVHGNSGVLREKVVLH